MSRALAHLGAAAACALLGLAVAQPLFTDDIWWHLGLGRAFAADGPWLAADPLLFGAAGPPSPAAWLFDLSAFGLLQAGGFPALRVAFLAGVAACLALGWSLARRAGQSAALASAALFVWIALSTYRFAQLRPHLVSMLLAPLLFRLLFERGEVPSWRRVAVAVALFALWANTHAGFPVGLLLLGAGTAAVAAAALGSGVEADRRRAQRLAACFGLCLAATALNPIGLESHAAWFAAGDSTPGLAAVMDEWVPANPLAPPRTALPPTPLAWLCLWGLLLGTAACLPSAVADLRRSPAERRFDPAWLGLALASLIGMVLAVRFLWLGLFPLLLCARALGPRAARPRVAWALALVPVLGSVALARVGDWPLVTRGLPRDAAGWAEPYAARKYYARPLWLLRDAGLSGHLYCDYFQGGFAGFWLATPLRAVVNGSLNVADSTLYDLAAVAERVGAQPGEGFVELLDRLEIDVFLGIRLPETGNPHRPWASTTSHLEDTPGWVQVFRNLDSALYLRRNERNEENLARIARHYAGLDVPFDPERGFDPLAAIRAAPEWALAQGLAPRDFAQLEHRALASSGFPRARARLAVLYTVLGAYEEAVALDRRNLALRGGDPRALRRLVWNLLRLGDTAGAEALAPDLAARPPGDALSHAIALAAVEVGALEPEAARARLARLPVFHRAELPRLIAGMQPPSARAD